MFNKRVHARMVNGQATDKIIDLSNTNKAEFYNNRHVPFHSKQFGFIVPAPDPNL